MLAPISLITLVIAGTKRRSLNRDRRAKSFAGATELSMVSCLGIAINLWLWLVPRHDTLWQAAFAPSTRVFLLIGALFLLSVIIMYIGWSQQMFLGKIRAGHY